MYSISLQVVDLQGYLWLTAYFHYFTPGSLRLKTKVRKVAVYRLQELMDNGPVLETRRWMMKYESPYPGYCRAPGKAACLPLLCDCDYLTDIWNKKWRDNSTRSNIRLLFKKDTIAET
ncbi:uncharacterized protein LOC125234978 isoform X2 [Leguminivora glycinivorella]|uniref:uncharacterized protein LOC125234978 isoform X2 n=1 Tax=Leguminivora glycinivorella TaxID=1035111 RepID=UPI00200CF4F9|nr:uncharacterized protein LOC125234978 isoform X2 [Leguminivora glycinivorella]